MKKIKEVILMIISVVFLFVLVACSSSVDIMFGNYKERTSLGSTVRIVKSEDGKNIEIYEDYDSHSDSAPLILLNSKSRSQEKEDDRIKYLFDSVNKDEPSVEFTVMTKASSGVKKGQISSFKINDVEYELSPEEQ